MAKSARSLDEQLRRLTAAKTAPADEARAEVRKALACGVGLLTTRAADLARTLRMTDLMGDLVAAFAAHMDEPATDKGCEAKVAIVRALHELDYDQTDVFEQGIRHVQMEGGYGGAVDAAIPLRAASALALAGRRHRKVLQLLLPLLVDPASQVRAAAARAIASTGRTEGELLLRLKVLTGDRDEDVLIELLAGCLDLGGEESLEFVARFLHADNDTMCSAAALALGGSRVRGAFEALRDRWTGGVDGPFAQVLLLALATMRDDRAMEFLLSLIRQGSFRDASAAIRALKSARPDEKTRELMRLAIAQGDPRLEQVLREGG